MASSKTIHVTAETNLAEVLDEARHAPVLLEQEGTVFWVEARDRPNESYDPEVVRRVVGEMAGSISEDEARALITDLYRAREEGTRPVGSRGPHPGSLREPSLSMWMERGGRSGGRRDS